MVITVDELHKRYGDTQAVNGLSFSVKKGEIFGIIGPNGAGKTTTIEILEGLRKRDSGHVDVLGLDPQKQRNELNTKIGVQFQATSIQDDMKVKEALDLFASFYPNGNKDHYIVKKLGLPSKMNTFFKDLSGGWKQKLTLALAILHSPEIVFLDEPSMGLDPQARRELWDIIRLMQDNGTTILLTTHYMEEAEKLCDRIAMIYGGKIEALGEPSLLLEELTTHYLIFESQDVEESVLVGLPGVNRIESDGNMTKVQSADLQLTAYHLFNEANKHEWTIRSFRFERGSLDDLFVHLLNKEEEHEYVI